MKVLGIDPGTAVVGYGVVEDGRTTPRLVECGVIRTGARETLAARLRTISEGVTELIARHRDQKGQPVQRVAFVSHGGFFMRLVCAMLKLPWRQASMGLRSWFLLNNCSISRFDIRKNEITVAYVNRTDHLPDHLIT